MTLTDTTSKFLTQISTFVKELKRKKKLYSNIKSFIWDSITYNPIEQHVHDNIHTLLQHDQNKPVLKRFLYLSLAWSCLWYFLYQNKTVVHNPLFVQRQLLRMIKHISLKTLILCYLNLIYVLSYIIYFETFWVFL